MTATVSSRACSSNAPSPQDHTLHVEPHHPRRRRRAIRKLGFAAALSATALVIAQVVLAAPTADFTISDTTPTRGQSVTFTATATPDEGRTIASYEWEFGDGTTGTGREVSHAYDTLGTKDVTLTVTDSARETTVVEKPAALQVVNVPPTASVSCMPESVRPNEATTCSASASDPEGLASNPYAWDIDGDGFDDGSDATEQFSFPSPGTYTIRLQVTDSDETTATAEDTVTVVGNSAPTAVVDCSPNQVNQGEPVNCTSAGSSDPDGGNLRYEWRVDGGAFSEGGPSFSSQNLGPGDHTIMLRVTDNAGESATAEDTVTVVNTPPVAGEIIHSPEFPMRNQPIQLASTAADPDAADRLSFAWDLDNDEQFDDSTSPNPTTSFATPGAKTIRLRVTDTGGISKTATKTILIQETVPNAGFTFAPDFPLPGQAVAFNSTSVASAGKSIGTLEWDFDYDGVPANFNVEAVGSSVTHSFASPGLKRVGLRATEVDGGFAIATATVTVNAPPRASFSVAPENAFVGDTVTLSSTSADPDGPLVRQDWDLDNDGQFDDATGAVVSMRFANPGTYPLKLRVTDARGATATAEGRVNVLNRPVPPPQLLRGVLVQLGERLFRRYTRVIYLRVRAPSGSKVAVRCRGKRCPKRVAKTSRRSKRMVRLHAVKTSKGSKKMMRFKAFERRFRPKTKLVVTVTKSGFIGTQTTYTIRRRKQARRRDLCVFPGVKTASRCPEQ
jgi:PKD repeat protein